MAIVSEVDQRVGVITQRLLRGKVVPFLGAGANLAGRQPALRWRPATGLPSGGELATYLMNQLFGDPPEGYPAGEPRDLIRVSQYATALLGEPALHEHLREVFAHTYEPTAVHCFLAELPALVAAAAKAEDRLDEPERPLIVTTNYDDALEKALDDAGEPYDLVAYIASGRHEGKFLHRSTDGKSHVITHPNNCPELSLRDRTVVLKLHGAVDRQDSASDSYVITEDDYIRFLARRALIPTPLLSKMEKSHFLFLGYGLRDWNLRVILHRLWPQARMAYASWSVQVAPSEIDKKVWQDHDVEIFDLDVAVFVTKLAARLEAAVQAAAGS